VNTGIISASSLNSFSLSVGGEPIVTFKPDGTVEVNPKYTIDDAARRFWDMVSQLAITQRMTREEERLVYRWHAENKRLREALEPFVKHQSSEPTVTITVKLEAVEIARAALTGKLKLMERVSVLQPGEVVDASGI
jgi:hypothetical protein